MSNFALYHYTTADAEHLGSIYEEGVIRVATALLKPLERPAVWFSKRPHYDPVAIKWVRDVDTGVAHRPTFEQMVKMFGAARIGVDPVTAPYNWTQFRGMSRIARKEANRLERVAYDQGADPADWFVSFKPVPREQWTSIEVYECGMWTPVNALEIAS